MGMVVNIGNIKMTSLSKQIFISMRKKYFLKTLVFGIILTLGVFSNPSYSNELPNSTLELRKLIKKISNDEFTIELLKFIVHNSGRIISHKNAILTEEGELSVKYKLLTYTLISDVEYGRVAREQKLLPLGETLYSLIMNELTVTINYKNELRPIMDVVFPKINLAFDGLTKEDIKGFINTGRYSLDRFNAGTREEKTLNKLATNGLVQISKNSHSGGDLPHSSTLTELGKEVYKQIFSIAQKRLNLR